MKLKLENLKKIQEIIDSPLSYDVEKMRVKTMEFPTWLHFGAGNIFRGYIARLNQELLNRGLIDRGIIVGESFDGEIIEKIYRPYDNLTLSVTLRKEGEFKTDLIANLAESIVADDMERLRKIAINPQLQVISFTITEKGYNLYGPNGEFLEVVQEDMASKPENARHMMSKLAYLLHERYRENEKPIGILSLDNCSHNGEKIQESVRRIVTAWVDKGYVEKEFLNYIEDKNKVSFPWSMIDKITPRPAEEVQQYLENLGFENMDPIITEKHTYIAPFVNSEEAEYLVIEDQFPNGRPPLEKAGVYMTDRQTVNKVERMKVTTCLNPLHTTLAVYGCLLGYDRIYREMEDPQLLKLIEKIGYEEALPVVVDPKILNPKDFIDEVLEIRLPNPHIPDAPQRIATDTSQKVSIRFGETIKAYEEKNEVEQLTFIPLALAGWLRYLLGVDDQGQDFERSADPLLEELTQALEGISYDDFQETKGLDRLLQNENIFGINLKEIGIDRKIKEYLEQLCQGNGAVRKTLEKYVG
ncbi:MAG: mannitol dehydrogenase family protein [Tissierellia bacterium]|nr:mannitol dehydrogenase family protein [Tissierellia bacterium]